MTDHFTLKIPEPDGERHNERRKDMGLTWLEYMDGQAPEPVDMDALASNIADRIDARGGVGPEAIAREVAREMDYAELSNRVAEELEGRMR